MERNDRSLLERLVEGRIDPRRGVNQWIGTVRSYAIPLYLAAFSIAMVVHKATNSAIASFAKQAVVYSALAAIFVCWLVPIGIRYRTRRRCAEHSYFLCPWCRYALAGLEDRGTCPECGHRYDRGICEELYRRAYSRSRSTNKPSGRGERACWAAAIRMREDDASIV